jgi:hypothetical protein
MDSNSQNSFIQVPHLEYKEPVLYRFQKWTIAIYLREDEVPCTHKVLKMRNLMYPLLKQNFYRR